MDKKPPSVTSLVLIPAILTLIITVLRLVGELNGWNPTWFGTATAGGDGALLGISWLIFVFGLWFGWKVQRSGAGVKRPGKTMLLALGPIAVLFGGFALCNALGLIAMPTAEQPGEPTGMAYFLGVLALAGLLSILVWPRIGTTLLVYAVLARVPVVAVTWLAVERGWETHYVKLPPEFTAPPEGELFTMLAMPQITFWPVITIVFGTVMAALGALLARRPKG